MPESSLHSCQYRRIWFLVAVIVRRIRQLDEFLRHVHLEAVAIPFLLTGLAVSVYGYLQKAHVVRPLNVGTVWIFMLTALSLLIGPTRPAAAAAEGFVAEFSLMMWLLVGRRTSLPGSSNSRPVRLNEA